MLGCDFVGHQLRNILTLETWWSVVSLWGYLFCAHTCKPIRHFLIIILSSPFTTPSLICSLQSCLQMYQETSSVPALFPAHIVFRFLSISCMYFSKSTWFKRTKRTSIYLDRLFPNYVSSFFSLKNPLSGDVCSFMFLHSKNIITVFLTFPCKKQHEHHQQTFKKNIQKC